MAILETKAWKVGIIAVKNSDDEETLIAGVLPSPNNYSVQQ